MTLFLSRFMTEADAEWLVTAFHVLLAGCVFAFLTTMILFS
jgi:hypothetical protein